jgi:nucleotide-binding universal stress UspA family protein
MTSHTGREGAECVVVGVDGSAPSARALEWALRLAARHGWTVELVTAWPEPAAVFVHEVPGHVCAPRERAAAVQASALRLALTSVPDPPRVRSHLDNAHPVVALRQRSQSAELVVVGSGGGTRHPHPGRPSVSESLALIARRPVVVIHDHAAEVRRPRRVGRTR